MKNILVDLLACQPVAGSKFHGGGEFIKTVFRELSSYQDRCNLIVYYNHDIFLDDWIKRLIKENSMKEYDVKSYKEINVPKLFDGIDIYFAGLLGSLRTVDIPDGVKVIGVYHGLRSQELPIIKDACIYHDDIKGYAKEKIKWLFRKSYSRRKCMEMDHLLKKCDYCVGDSIHSKYSLKCFYPYITDNRIKIYYAPAKYVDNDLKSVDIKNKYILMLGGNRWTKNVYGGMKALDVLYDNKQLDELRTVIIGKVSERIKKRIHNLDKFIFLDYVEAGELEYLYQNCEFFFYPTLNEGFGYPPLEAMHYDKTCVISAVTSLPEIYGDSVYYCNPNDTMEMAMRILQASETKIDKKVIQSKYIEIQNKQKTDLADLCQLIVNGG